MVFPDKVRLIQQSKAIDTNSLIGYIGGYIVPIKFYKAKDVKHLEFNEEVIDKKTTQ